MEEKGKKMGKTRKQFRISQKEKWIQEEKMKPNENLWKTDKEKQLKMQNLN